MINKRVLKFWMKPPAATIGLAMIAEPTAGRKVITEMATKYAMIRITRHFIKVGVGWPDMHRIIL